MCLLAPAAAAAMAEAELQEADGLWPAHHHHHHSPDDDDGRDDDQRHQPHCRAGRKQPCLRPRVDDDDAARGGSKVVRRPLSSSSSSTAPVAIIVPTVAAATTTRPSASSWWAEEYYGDDDEAAAFVPPHVALEARRRLSEGRAASSMCEGRGRTLKGRDLQSVRTAVLRMTGFIET